ncbi:hypothetical protein [Myceligenerans pegani]|uniref:Uncharacterized protein n=1 Tax=Myceligenerans pegani TaxID=2776917 RepID=A0ABR9MSY0_9MICO|nr:hypothetical protein [Myceligenerans sp. TRM 65318]MBE1874485.1 hypothetical protein [Myceligenerans sp. TRM 65318]MBE3016756.1 hypothetical protein [Myceligenerans sp. TRM 65318]
MLWFARICAGSMVGDRCHDQPKGHSMSENVAVLDRATADLFDLDVRVMPVPGVRDAADTDTTKDGCTGTECPSCTCTPTCNACK